MAHENDAPLYEAVSLRCHACATRDLAADDATEANRGRRPPGRYYIVRERV